MSSLFEKKFQTGGSPARPGGGRDDPAARGAGRGEGLPGRRYLPIPQLLLLAHGEVLVGEMREDPLTDVTAQHPLADLHKVRSAGLFYFSGPATRAQMATIVMRCCALMD